MFKKIIIGLIVLVIVALVVAYFARNMMVETAVEEGSSYALGTETELGSAGLNIGGGSLKLDNLEIDNPEGFESEYFMTLKRGVLDVDAGSILDDEVRVDSFVIEGVRLNLEQIDTKGNYKVLMDNLKKLDLGESSESGSQKFHIGMVALRDIEVTGALTLMGKKQYEQSFAVDNFTIKDIGTGDGATIGEITSRVMKELITRSVTAGKGILPGGFGEKLDQLKHAGAEKLDSLKQEGAEKLEAEAKDKLKDIGGSLLGGDK